MAKKEESIPFVIRDEWGDELEMLSMEERGELFTMLFRYSRTREIPETDNRILSIVFRRWAKWLDQDYEKLMEKRRKRQEAGRAGGLAKAKVKRDKESVAMLPFATKIVANLASNQLPVTSSSTTHIDNTGSNTSTTQEKEKEIEKEKIPVSDSLSPGIPQDEFAAVISFYMDNISVNPPPIVVSLIRSYMADMNGSVIIEAINEAIGRNIRNWPYIKSILQNWKDNGVADIDTLEEYRKSEYRRKPNNGRNDAIIGSDTHDRDKAEWDGHSLPGITILG